MTAKVTGSWPLPRGTADAPVSPAEIDHRVLVDGAPVGDPWTAGVATTRSEFVDLWAEVGLADPIPAVDMTKSVVLCFGAVENPGPAAGERSCPADANPHAVVVAVDRADLPMAPLDIWVDNEELLASTAGDVGHDN